MLITPPSCVANTNIDAVRAVMADCFADCGSRCDRSTVDPVDHVTCGDIGTGRCAAIRDTGDDKDNRQIAAVTLRCICQTGKLAAAFPVWPGIEEQRCADHCGQQCQKRQSGWHGRRARAIHATRITSRCSMKGCREDETAVTFLQPMRAAAWERLVDGAGRDTILCTAAMLRAKASPLAPAI